jgi:hypothetical protein
MILRPDFGFAAAIVLLAVVATVGVVVGPPSPTLETAAPRTEVVASPEPDQRAEPAAPAIASRRAERAPSRTERAARPDDETAPSASGGTEVASALERTFASPSGRGGSVRHAADGSRKGIRTAAARPGGVSRVAMARPALAPYEPLIRPVAVDVVAESAPRPTAPIPIAWRLYADASTHQAP